MQKLKTIRPSRPFSLLNFSAYSLIGCGLHACSGVEDPEKMDDSMSWEDPDLATGGAPMTGTGGNSLGEAGSGGNPGTGGLGSGGTMFTGGASATGGATNSGGAASGGSTSDTGGTTSSGGAASGGATNTGGSAATGGNSSTGGGSAECVTSSPPQAFVQTLNATWQEMTGQLASRGAGARGTSSSILNFDNSILDQIDENQGTLNYCVRYESTVTLSATNRDKLEAALERNINEWVERIADYDCFPHDKIEVKIVGWAAMNRATFDWSDGAHPGKMYIGDNSFESAPQCAQACGRFFHKQPGYSYPGCEGGRNNHYDMSLWLTEGMNGGAGGDWGQRVGRGYMIGAIDQNIQHILAHEVGHGFGFPDYYNWSTWVPGVAAPHTIMVAGASSEVTEWDTWMMRRLWTEMKDDRGW